MFGRILVANRGEIARRVMRTCREMGIATVAVFSDADADAPFVRDADEAVRIGPAPSAESYLVIDRIIAAAKRTGADAIHPGYGFLAENAAFAEACADAGIVFIGPPAEAIRLLGSKRESKQTMAEAGVPVIPGYDGADQDPEVLQAKAEEIGFPVLLKASAGGGGKGMRVVHSAGDVASAIESAKREAASSFGDDTLLVERYIERPRHIEFQILGDQHGNLIHLYERECSVQRRHQKIIEETPSTALTETLRARMGAAAVEVGRAANYYNAGTVEFILAPDGEFYFLEVNTRLQVEHPITECITGIDLVREQIRVAQGEALGIEQGEAPIDGAAIECRLYAEDADNGFLPTTGRLADWHCPPAPGLRIDTGVESGQQVSIHYDPMLAKIICHAPTRAEAIQRMRYSLRSLAAPGVVTNREYLVRVLGHPQFRAGEYDTHFVDTHAADLAAPELADADVARSAAAVTLFDHERRRRSRSVLPHIEPGWSNNRLGDERVTFARGDDELDVRYRNLGGGRFQIAVNGQPAEWRLVSATETSVAIECQDMVRTRHRVVRDGRHWYAHSPNTAVTLRELPRFPEADATAVAGACVAPMPGKVVKVLVSEGQSVAAGDTLVILEAMKMEHAAKAAEAGVVERVAVAEGDQVEADALLVVVKPGESA